MRIAFSSDENKGLEAKIANHFGRCNFFIIVDVEEGHVKIETKKNPFLENHEPGKVPEFIAKQNVDIMVAGGMGPRALEWFKKLGVTPITGIDNTIKDVLEDILSGKINNAEPCKEGEHNVKH
ncbi:MAG: NifB/NifX family molybdenum-iron cluster-binding protein [Candidatus Diapherotrites archaeon]|nr:NifB/NifX family molybdenum-iron cluster-binding protein [Candidatus Diapherotrites archaeon]